ncbi:Clavaminate synthase-like protein [Cubamyces sp. BRFM 1775]|nr:Clavaminate synthase-like protein [Cubamyces sp. BRFM 1775]
MPVLTIPPCAPFSPAPPTKQELEWAPLPVIDFSEVTTPEGLARIAAQVCNAMRTFGFLYIVNHGYSRSQNERIFDIADAMFTKVPDDEKKRLVADFEKTGSYKGYKARQTWLTTVQDISNGVRDQIEQYNLHRAVTDPELQEHPRAMEPFLPELRAFTEHNHYNVMHPLLRMLAQGMELPEETFVRLHNFDSPADTSARMMKYYPRLAAEEAQTNNVWLKGHTDIGTITILWSQPVSGLQILCPDGKWRWVRHIDNALTVNIGDSMEFLSGGYYKATIHRVRQPPADQAGYARLGVFYFGMADDDVVLRPRFESPVLQRVGVAPRFDLAHAPTMRQYRTGVTSAYGVSKLSKRADGHEEEVIHGVVVKHFN